MNWRMRSRRSALEVKLARLSKRRTKMLNHSSIWLSQDVCLGVYTKRIRCAGSDKNAAREAMQCNVQLLPFTPNSSQPTALRHQAHQAFRLMDVEVIDHKHPA